MSPGLFLLLVLHPLRQFIQHPKKHSAEFLLSKRQLPPAPNPHVGVQKVDIRAFGGKVFGKLIVLDEVKS